ncbi:putative RNA binding protein YcfA (HicA-like mRNA interferase family) [Methanofollis sp. W23]|uniref:type II toxin-antitoxin system HicA family toxin n=1 Tax=Methanofollis sp. W23 TaxID=2817849 RepID=UPI001AE1D3E0|nr:type II toxin-antitoxin system HicA family toxin [Methanofollis sp. W23]MBP2145905.1 putative RNA binding protein YcfA (HicA-like mRNA interferase family) [Methanofollis sp. W23]
MTRLSVISSDRVIRVLKKIGFDFAPKRSRGSQIALSRLDESGRPLLVVVPRRGDLPVGTLLSVLQQAALPKERFLLLVREAVPVSS